ncbi:hypothetical protein B484DRAFT_437212 [Ochromonadaceae sp. CCMP2298]|nr:hypothetical protein B484DRAFT_437212 [Ochromonadaceae sp. CCMP2298]
MERLIDQLQKTLDEDEAAKDAGVLLLLRSGDKRIEVNLFPSQARQSSGTLYVTCRQRLERALLQTPNVYVLQCIAAFFTTGNEEFQDLPMKIAALQFNLCPALMLEIYEENRTCSSWPPTFTGCFLQVLDVFEHYVLKLLEDATSNPYLDRIHALRQDMIEVRGEPRGTVAKYILVAILQYIQTQAKPLQIRHSSDSLEGAQMGTRELQLDQIKALAFDPPPAGDPDESSTFPHEESVLVMLAPLELKMRRPKHL